MTDRGFAVLKTSLKSRHPPLRDLSGIVSYYRTDSVVRRLYVSRIISHAMTYTTTPTTGTRCRDFQTVNAQSVN